MILREIKHSVFVDGKGLASKRAGTTEEGVGCAAGRTSLS